LEFKNIILEAQLSNKFKICNDKFLPRKAISLSISERHDFSVSKQGVPKPWKPFHFLKNFHDQFVFVGQFFFQKTLRSLFRA
jgi:hypothetical protein